MMRRRRETEISNKCGSTNDLCYDIVLTYYLRSLDLHSPTSDSLANRVSDRDYFTALAPSSHQPG
jgi:hypothetical protein